MTCHLYTYGGFSQIAPEVLGISLFWGDFTWNDPYLFVGAFDGYGDPPQRAISLICLARLRKRLIN